MKRWLLGMFCGLALAVGAHATVVALNPDHPSTYIVVKGDTLWDISARFLQDPWLWPEVWDINRHIENPHLIYPGDVLSLTYVGDQPRLRLSRGHADETVKLSPGVRSELIGSAIPAIPLDEINAFLNKSRFVEQEDFNGAPYVVAGTRQKIISGPGDSIYARGGIEPGSRSYGVYRSGKLYTDPETGEALGVQATDIAGVKWVDQEGDIATLVVNESTQEVRGGDRLLESEARSLDAVFHPSAPEQPVAGVILDVESGVTQIGSMDVVMVNLGAREGLQPGNVMAIHRLGEVVVDPVTRKKVKLPDVSAGLLMYFGVYEKMSYALVLEADQALSVGDRVDMP